MFLSQIVSGQTSPNANDANLGLGGYDVVSYHTDYSAIRGTQTHSTQHKGVTYYFKNADNKNAFLKSPDNYLPQYGGYCAFAMAMKGLAAPCDPHTFKIRDGKLYLFYNDFYEGTVFNTIVPWNQEEVSNIAKADANWRKIK